MKFRHFASAIAALALAGCSNDDVVLDNNQQTDDSSAAYMKVNIGFANGFSSRGTSGGFQESTDEHAIKHADFYFYTENGEFYTKTSMGAIDDVDDTTEGTNNNIETTAEPVIVIEKTTNKLPGYLLVVLNNEAAKLDGMSLAKAAEEIGTWEVASTGANGTGFIMTNSTYNGAVQGAQGDYLTNAQGQYFATPVSEDDFHKSRDEALDDENPVDIYVERLAAKVSLNYTAPANGTSIKVNTADQDEASITIDVIGWALNGTEKNSYLMKNINTAWAATGTNVISVADWNDVNNRRSYWANSAASNDTYPGSYKIASEAKMVGDKTDVTEADEFDVTGYGLNYVSYDELNNKVGNNEFEYCRENTLSTSRLENNLLNSATSVLIAAQISTKEDYFLYGETLYEEDGMKAQIMSMYSTDLNDYFIEDTNGKENVNGTFYRGLDVTDIEFYSPYDGYITIKLNKTKGWGKITGEGDAKTFTNSQTDLNTLIDNIASKLLAAKIQGFKEGRMYYNIPIEHLGKFNKDTGNKEIKYNHAEYKNTENVTNVIEGQYGVVRNHIYNVTVNSIKNLGRGVYNPSEDIIPNVQDAELYYLAAEIKVLSWHIVNQGADL